MPPPPSPLPKSFSVGHSPVPGFFTLRLVAPNYLATYRFAPHSLLMDLFVPHSFIGLVAFFGGGGGAAGLVSPTLKAYRPVNTALHFCQRTGFPPHCLPMDWFALRYLPID